MTGRDGWNPVAKVERHPQALRIELLGPEGPGFSLQSSPKADHAECHDSIDVCDVDGSKKYDEVKGFGA
jgi:hypothetical protein